MTTNTIQEPTRPAMTHASPLDCIQAACEYVNKNNTTLDTQVKEANKTMQQAEARSKAIESTFAAVNTEMDILVRGIEKLKKEIEIKQKEKAELETNISLLEGELRDNDLLIKRSDSLYKNFPKQAPAKALDLRVDGNKLVATSQSAVKFPCDLVVALKDAKVTGSAVPGKATCFLFIRKQDWTAVTQNQWTCEWNTKIKGLAPGTYEITFNHLLIEEYDCKLNFRTQKITIR